MTKFYREQKVELFYFTDPLCYHCWDFEPYLNKLLQVYDNYVDLHIIMGKIPVQTFEGSCHLFPMLRDLKAEALQLPAKVFRVFSALAPDKSQLFLRMLRQSLFVERIDVSSEKVLAELVDSLGEPASEVLERALDAEGKKRLDEDGRLAKRFGVTQIPTMVLVHNGRRVKLEGIHQEDDIKAELISLLGHKPQKSPMRSLEEELKLMKRLYLRDLEVLYNLNPNERRDYVEGSLKEGTYAWIKGEDGDYYLEAR